MSAAAALQAAVRAALAADAGLAAIVGQTVYDGPQRNAAPPSLHFGPAAERDWSTATEEGAEVTFSLVAVSRERSRDETLAILERARAVLHDAALAPSGWRLVSLRLLAAETPGPDRTETRRATARYRARLEPLG